MQVEQPAWEEVGPPPGSRERKASLKPLSRPKFSRRTRLSGC